MATLAEFTLTDTRSMRADFMELSALFSSRGKSSKATILGVLDLSNDGAVPFVEPEGEYFDEEIVESEREQLVTKTFEELLYRQYCLEGAYPFTVDPRTQTLSLLDIKPEEHCGRAVYLFCLLASAIRVDQLQGGRDLDVVEAAIPTNFQICACLAAGGFLAGHVSSFGFPRATGESFLPALQDTFARFGVGSVRAEILDGMPQDLKDGGIDVIAWRELPDRMPGKLYLLGQSASGKNWKSKSVVEYIEQLHGSWFTEAPAALTATPAMFIPFPLHHDMDEPRRDSFVVALKRLFWHEEKRYGIIFDRIRIPHLANVCINFDPDARQRVESADQFARIDRWVTETVSLFRSAQ
jgi:hypothetical protein